MVCLGNIVKHSLGILETYFSIVKPLKKQNKIYSPAKDLVRENLKKLNYFWQKFCPILTVFLVAKNYYYKDGEEEEDVGDYGSTC